MLGLNLPKGVLNIANQTYGYVTAISFSHIEKHKAVWNCVCKCGKEIKAKANALRSGHTKSCGCYNIEVRVSLFYKHGYFEHPFYSIWERMKARCYNKNHFSYYNYGGRGIEVCKLWREHPEAFIDFIESNYTNWKELKVKGYELDRINVNGPYAPWNCRLISRKENNRNKRTNHIVKFEDKEMCITAFAELISRHPCSVLAYLRRGLTTEEIYNKCLN